MNSDNRLMPIRIPLLNPNEPEALLADLLAVEGEAVCESQPVALIETTKSTGEITASREGYLVGLCFEAGQVVKAGDVLAYVADSPDARDPSLPPWADEAGESTGTPGPEGLRMTRPARELALARDLDLASLPRGPLVTRRMIESLLAGGPNTREILSRPVESARQILIYGAGGHGRSLAALVSSAGVYEMAGFLDDGASSGETVLGLPVLGGAEALDSLRAGGIRLAVNGVGGIGNLDARLTVFDRLAAADFICPAVIHPTAFLEESAECSPAVQVFPLAYIGTQVTIGFGAIVNTGAIVSHDCVLGTFVNLSPGATLAGGVVVGEGALIGMRATVNLGVHVGRRAQIGNGATVKADVPEGGIVPAGAVWPFRRG
jgi:sugar O-acyltransferase (sialic acid O-acetyltransferase NeuD family)